MNGRWCKESGYRDSDEREERNACWCYELSGFAIFKLVCITSSCRRLQLSTDMSLRKRDTMVFNPTGISVRKRYGYGTSMTATGVQYKRTTYPKYDCIYLLIGSLFQGEEMREMLSKFHHCFCALTCISNFCEFKRAGKLFIVARYTATEKFPLIISLNLLQKIRNSIIGECFLLQYEKKFRNKLYCAINE